MTSRLVRLRFSEFHLDQADFRPAEGEQPDRWAYALRLVLCPVIEDGEVERAPDTLEQAILAREGLALVCCQTVELPGRATVEPPVVDIATAAMGWAAQTVATLQAEWQGRGFAAFTTREGA